MLLQQCLLVSKLYFLNVRQTTDARVAKRNNSKCHRYIIASGKEPAHETLGSRKITAH